MGQPNERCAMLQADTVTRVFFAFTSRKEKLIRKPRIYCWDPSASQLPGARHRIYLVLRKVRYNYLRTDVVDFGK